MKWKLTLGVILVLVVTVGTITVYNTLKHNETENDSMVQMDMGHDSMEEMDTGNDSMAEMDMGNDSMEEMEMGHNEQTVAGFTGIKVDARKQQLIGMKMTNVAKRALTRVIRTYGIISHDTELYAAQQEYLSAYRYYQSLNGSDGQEMAKLLLDSARKKLTILGYRDAQIKDLIARGQSDDSLIEGGSSTHTWVYAQVYQNDLPYIRRGQRVQVSNSGLQGKIFYGTIESMDTVVDPETRSVRTRILVKNTDATITHESYVNVAIEVPLGTVVAIPEEAIIDAGGRQIAFVNTGEGYFEPRELVLGRQAEGYYEVISGLKMGERIVSSANFFIDSESQLKAATGNMGSHQHK